MEKNINIEVEIKSFKTLFEGRNDSVFFVIDLRSGKVSWQIEKRYSDLRNLYDQLVLNHSNMPDFPRKTFFQLKKFEDIDDRRKQLDFFFKEIFQRQDMLKDVFFLSFFEIISKLNIHGQEYLKLSMHIENQALGFRDFLYNKEEKIFIALLGDMSGISRIDSYVTNNLKFPWEKSPEELVFSVGLLEFYVYKPVNQVDFHKKFNISFSTQVICCDFNSTLGCFATG